MTRQLNKKVWTEKVVLAEPSESDYAPRDKWLKEKFGSYGNRWYVIINNNKTFIFYFKNEEDAVLFALRWA